MRYEIINPSDKCFISSENEKVACFCNLLLGDGLYGPQREDGSTADNIHLFEYSEEQINKDYEGDFKKFSEVHSKEIIECFKSFEYPSERTSLNNIGEKAKELAELFEKRENKK